MYVYMCTFKRISVHIIHVIVGVLIISGLQLSKFVISVGNW